MAAVAAVVVVGSSFSSTRLDSSAQEVLSTYLEVRVVRASTVLLVDHPAAVGRL
jgi:hypothetical protein